MQSSNRNESLFKHPDGSLERYASESKSFTLAPAFLYGVACIAIFLTGQLAIESLIAWKFQLQCPAGEVFIHRGLEDG